MKWKNILKTFALIAMALSMTSCIELIEEMYVHNDKSGSWEIRLEAGGLQSLFGTIGSYLNEDMVKGWKQIPSEKIKKLEAIKGVSNVHSNKTGDFVIGLKFDYENPRALNKALYALLGADKKFFYPKLYKHGKHRFKKLDIGNQLFKRMGPQIEKLENKSWLEYVSLKSVYHLPGNEVELKSKEKGNYTLKKNTYIQKHNLLQLSSQDNDLGVKLKY